jgi:hypothetical protein
MVSFSLRLVLKLFLCAGWAGGPMRMGDLVSPGGKKKHTISGAMEEGGEPEDGTEEEWPMVGRKEWCP